MINYKDSRNQFRMMQVLKEQRQRYYVAADLTVMVRYNNKWVPYHEAMEKDCKLKFDAE